MEANESKAGRAQLYKVRLNLELDLEIQIILYLGFWRLEKKVLKQLSICAHFKPHNPENGI